jgi:AraC family carnitine catabolism transcriptional activator
MAEGERHDRPVLFWFVLVPRFNMLALTAALEPLRVANYLSGRGLYEWAFLAPGGGTVTASNGMDLDTAPLPAARNRVDTVFVCGSWNSEHYENPELFSWLRRLDRAGVRLGSMDIATYVLARAGLLAGRRAAVLWYCIRAFSEAYPEIETEDCLFIADRSRITIAGGTAGLDAMIDEIRGRHGARLGQEVADHILHHPVRSSHDAQRRPPAHEPVNLHPVLRSSIALMDEHVEEPLTIPQVAAHAGVSQRKLERLFKAQLGRSAVAYYRMLRLQHARVLLTSTQMSVREISIACGYSSLSHFAKSFARQFGRRPRESRIAWPDDDPAPVWLGLTATTGQPGPDG